MPLRPRFKAQFLVKVLPPDLVFLLTETGHITLEGRLYAMLAPHLDGRHAAGDIVRLLGGRLTLLDVEFGLLQLEKAGYLAGPSGAEPGGREAFREMLGVERRLASERWRRPVAIKTIGAVRPDKIAAALRSLGLRLARRAETTIVVTDDYLRAELAQLNREALDSRSPWMLVKPVGAVLWIGPVFLPGHTGCWECLADRLRQNSERRILCGAGPPSGEAVLSRAQLPATIELAAQLAALEVWKWMAVGRSEPLQGRLVTLDALSLALHSHALVRRDDCAACGAPGPPRKLRPLRLQRRLKGPFADGGYRTVPPEVTYERYRHHISPLLGVVDKIEPFHRDETGLVHVHLAGHNFALKYQRSLFAQWTAGRKSAGKGITRAQSLAGALCEALERYSGIFRGNEARRKATFRALGDQAIHPDSVLNFSAAQYARRDEWNAAEADFNWVPHPFDESRRIEWTPVWSLTRNAWRYLPAAYCYYNYPLSQDHDFCRPDSNGNAAGNNLEEAILQGFLEVVERDAAAIWWYNRLRRPSVDLTSFPQPYFRMLPDYYRRLGYDVWLLDITSDFAIPSFAAVACAAGAFLLGFGAHFDPQIAAARALTEMNQFLPVALAGRNVRLFTSPPPDIRFLLPDPLQAPRRLADFEFQPSGDLRDDIERGVALAGKLGLETLVLDQTRPDIGLCVVKVIVPGMRPFWARFAPGRLFDVPVKMGWLDRPLAEEELNPAHLAL